MMVMDRALPSCLGSNSCKLRLNDCVPQFPHVQNEHEEEDGNEFQMELTDTTLASMLIFINKTDAVNATTGRPAVTWSH